MKAGAICVYVWLSVERCRRYRHTVAQGSKGRGVCQYRCSVTGCHNSGQEAESND